MKSLFFAIAILISFSIAAQEDYPFVAETDPQAVQKLE